MMPKRIYKSIPLSAEARKSINEYCDKNGLNFAEETRNYWFRKIGRPDLKNETKMGRPPKQ